MSDKGYAIRLLTPRVAGNLALALLFGAEAARATILADEIGLLEAGFALAALMAGLFVLTRGPAIARDTSFKALLPCFIATAWPFLFLKLLPETDKLSPAVYAIQAFAVGLMIISIAVLGRNFSVLPEYRSFASLGPYAVVRHPIYASYLLFDGALAWQSFTAIAAAAWAIEALALYARASMEEALLRKHNFQYQAYIAKVRFRFFPFLL
jgi:protein-S-isoprenylcysteine O-methyltransferase Ste14